MSKSFKEKIISPEHVWRTLNDIFLGGKLFSQKLGIIHLFQQHGRGIAAISSSQNYCYFCDTKL